MRKDIELTTKKSTDLNTKLVQEEKEKQEVFLLLLDAVSKYKETIDVLFLFIINRQNEIQRFHTFAHEYSSE